MLPVMREEEERAKLPFNWIWPQPKNMIKMEYLNSDLHNNKHVKSPILRSISILESSFYIDLSCLLLTEHLLIESTLIDLD